MAARGRVDAQARKINGAVLGSYSYSYSGDEEDEFGGTSKVSNKRRGEEAQVTFGPGSLGLRLGESDRNGYPAVAVMFLVKKPDGSPGQAEASTP